LDQGGASSKHQQGPSRNLINHIRDHVGELRLREFRTVDASRMLRAIAKKNRSRIVT
jgi:hypothetical protein